MTEAASLPLMIVSGCLGAGKTTFVRSMLENSTMLRKHKQDGSLLLLVNDFASENVDAALLRQHVAEITSIQSPSSDHLGVDDDDGIEGSAGSPTVVPISGGCVCCNRLPDLIAALVSATHDCGARWKYAVLECTGLADPTPVVVALLLHPQLRTSVRIDAVVVLVDVSTYTVASDPLAGAQLKGCNCLLLNKASRTRRGCRDDVGASDDDDAWWGDTKRSLVEATENPRAKVWVCEYGRIGPFDDLLVGQYLFEVQQSRHYFMQQAASLLGRTDAERAAEEALETQRLGIHTFCFQLWMPPMTTTTEAAVSSSAVPPSSRRFFAPSVVPLDAVLRLVPAILKTPQALSTSHVADGDIRSHQRSKNKKKPSVWRSKGFFTATEAGTDHQYTWSSEGNYFDYAPVCPPFVTLPLGDHPQAPSPTTAAPHGANSRGSTAAATSMCIAEIVFIGTFDEDALVLESALLEAFGGVR